MRDAGLCGSCHTLYTSALGPKGEELAKFRSRCLSRSGNIATTRPTRPARTVICRCVNEAVAVTALYGQPREGMHRHVFVGSNFVMEGMLQDHRDELATAALPERWSGDEAYDAFLKTQAAKVTITRVDAAPNGLSVDVHVENLGGHKLPTAYPSRRAWLHFVVNDGNGVWC